jgi:hypothetical protein
MGKPYVEKDVVPIVQANRDANCARGLPSVRKDGTRGKRVAIVGYGPSLADTWPLIQSGKFDAVWTVSKAHDFLCDRGVQPTHHTDTDYREHKVWYNSRFQEATQYYLATQVHPSYLDRLRCHYVSLFHVVQPDGGTFDNRYFKQPVMFDAGLQAARLAYELGHRDQEWFGMDASARGAQTHAGPHEGLAPEFMEVLVAGEPRVLTTLLFRQALFAEFMLREIPRMRVKIHGDGALRPLLQERGKCRVS